MESKLEKIILEVLRDWYKQTEGKYSGTLCLTDEMIHDLEKSELYTIQEDGNYFQNLKVIARSDEDLGWWAIEFTGWPKDHPELIEFINMITIRENISGRYSLDIEDLDDKDTKKHITAKWNLNTLNTRKKNVPNLVKYEKRVFTKDTLDWSMLPIQCHFLARDEEGIDGSRFGLSLHGKRFCDNVGGQPTFYGADKLYNFDVIDLEFGEQIQRPEEAVVEYDPIEVARKNGQTVCHCGSRNTEPFRWNGQFHGFKCKSCATEMAYELLD